MATPQSSKIVDQINEGTELHHFGTDAKGNARGMRVRYITWVTEACEYGTGGYYMAAGTHFGIVAQPTRNGIDWQASTRKFWGSEAERFEGVAQYLRNASRRVVAG